MAWSHDTFCHSPLTSFIGYFRRRSPCTSSRTEAPLAQCEPRLIGLSQAGSCPTQTPFCTSAITVQPTEQCVQMFFLISVGAPTIFGPACALRTEPSGINPSAAPAPAARPDRCGNVRRSSTLAACGLPAGALSDGLLIAVSSFVNRLPCASLRPRKGLGFQFHKHTADAADGTVEIGSPGHLQIREHPRGPRFEMPLEESRLFSER